MIKTALKLMLLISGLCFAIAAKSQCTPGDENSCPDPEGNGQVCPAVMPNAISNQPYAQEFTILAPPQFTDPGSGLTVDLHHIEIKDVGNLPEGITWVSNAPDSVFLVGNYYCILLEGTPEITGTYNLKIMVDVYIPGIFGSPPIYVATAVDSTSLTLQVTDPQGINTFDPMLFKMISAAPNPFKNEAKLCFELAQPGGFEVDVYSLEGRPVAGQKYQAQQGFNTILIDGADFDAGIYIYTIRNKTGIYRGRLVKTR